MESHTEPVGQINNCDRRSLPLWGQPKRQKSPIPVSLLQVALPWQGVGLGDLQWSLPTPAIPGFWDSVWSVPAGAAKGGVPLSRLSCG